MNREKIVRKKIFELLSGNILNPNSSGEQINVYDGRADSEKNLYVVLDDQTANEDDDFKRQRYDSSCNVQIVHKQDDSYTKDFVDDISETIENILLAYFGSSGVIINNDWHVLNFRLSSVSYAGFKISETQTLCIKFLKFNFQTIKI